ncbi:MAG: hypothetical protein WAN58_04010, partial [Anaerolineales bacterium]
MTVSKMVEGVYKKENRNELRSFRNPKERRIDTMRLKLILPEVDPEQFEEPTRCINPKCQGRRFVPWQAVVKNVRDSEYEEVVAR